MIICSKFTVCLLAEAMKPGMAVGLCFTVPIERHACEPVNNHGGSDRQNTYVLPLNTIA